MIRGQTVLVPIAVQVMDEVVYRMGVVVDLESHKVTVRLADGSLRDFPYDAGLVYVTGTHT